MADGRIVFRVHALQRMFQRRISTADVMEVLKNGHIVENYPTDVPYPSRLISGRANGKPIHVVAADRTDANETIIIMVYEPDVNKWDSSFTKRKSP